MFLIINFLISFENKELYEYQKDDFLPNAFGQNKQRNLMTVLHSHYWTVSWLSPVLGCFIFSTLFCPEWCNLLLSFKLHSCRTAVYILLRVSLLASLGVWNLSGVFPNPYFIRTPYPCSNERDRVVSWCSHFANPLAAPCHLILFVAVVLNFHLAVCLFVPARKQSGDRAEGPPCWRLPASVSPLLCLKIPVQLPWLQDQHKLFAFLPTICFRWLQPTYLQSLLWDAS